MNPRNLPGIVKTDMGSDAAPRTVEQGAAIAVKLATMDSPPPGKFLKDNSEIPGRVGVRIKLPAS